MKIKKVFALAIAFVMLASTIGCTGENKKSEENSAGNSNATEKDGTEEFSSSEASAEGIFKQEQIDPYTWSIEPSIEADDIIVSDYMSYSAMGYHAACEASIIEVDGKYGIIHYDGSYIAEPKYESYTELSAMNAGQVVEVYDEKLGSVQVYNGEYGIDIEYDSPGGWGYMGYSYYIVDGIDGIISVNAGSEYNIDEASNRSSKGEFLKDETGDDHIVLVQEADGYIDENGDPWVYEETAQNKVGLATKEKGMITECEYTGGICPETEITVTALESNGKWGYFNSEGEQVIDFICEPTIFQVEYENCVTLDSYSSQLVYSGEGVPYGETDGIIAVKTEEGAGYFDIEGNELIAPGTFAEVRPFHEGNAWVKDLESGLWGVIQLTQDSEAESETESNGLNADVQYLGANFNNLQSGGLVAENDDIVVYLTYTEASVFNVDSYNNYDTIYTGKLWKYDKKNGDVSVILGGDGWDAMWSSSLSNYPVENLNVTEDGTVYFSRYDEGDYTRIFKLNSQTGEYEVLIEFEGEIQTMALIDNTLYFASELGVVSLDFTKNKRAIITEIESTDWNVKLLAFYKNCLYYSYESYDEETSIVSVMLGSYNIKTAETDLVTLPPISDVNSEQDTWINVYPIENGIISIDYDYLSIYRFDDGSVETYPEPYLELPEDTPWKPVSFVMLDGNYFSYTGNENALYSHSYQIIRLENDFSSVEDVKGLFSIFEASDGSSFIDRYFTFGVADDGVWAAGDSIVRKITADGNSETIYKE